MSFFENDKNDQYSGGAVLFALSTDRSMTEDFPTGLTATKYFSWDFDRLTEHISSVHHSYVRAVLPRLRGLLCELVLVSDDIHHAREKFLAMVPQWIQLLDFETLVLFPYVLELAEGQKGNHEIVPRSQWLIEEVAWVIQSNDSFRKNLSSLSIAMQGAALPDKYRDTLTEITDLLSRFRREFSILYFLENSILFPRALRMDSQLMTSET
jgi:regulator of cell morphogenesis and NO signaling